MTDALTLLASIKAGFDTLSAGLTIFKDAKGAINDNELRIKTQEWRTQLLDLQDKVLELRQIINTVKTENLDLKEHLTDLQSKLNSTLTSVRSQQAIALPEGWHRSLDVYRDKNSEAYCPACFEDNEVVVRLISEMGGMCLKCRKCNFVKVG